MGAPINTSITATGAAIPLASAVTEAVNLYFENSGSSNMYIGLSNVSSSQYITKLAAGAGFSLSGAGIGGFGAEIDISKLYMLGTASDKLMVTYTTASL